uniref:PDZ and LIM domain protein 7-like isoform X1 n=1 Tax=Myxine glutinosa TaxID=7769 RepID=UPI00358F2540
MILKEEGEKGRSECVNMGEMSVTLSGSPPWGFRLQGGKDSGQPLSISRVAPGGRALRAGVPSGAVVLSLAGSPGSSLSLEQARDVVKASGNTLTMSLSRPDHHCITPATLPKPKDVSRYVIYGSRAPPTHVARTPPGRRRLVTDTEDWRPHTGTHQSRSFRMLAELTGTQTTIEEDSEAVKKARERFYAEMSSPRYAALRDRHHQYSAHALHVET